MDNEIEKTTDLEELWGRGVDIRDAWKDLVPIGEQIVFDNLEEAPDPDLWDEASTYSARLLQGLREERFLAIGRTVGGDRGFRRIPPRACYKRAFFIPEGRFQTTNLHLEDVVIVFEPPSAPGTENQVTDGASEACRAELRRLEALAPREQSDVGRKNIDVDLLAAVRGLLGAGTRVHLLTQGRAITAIREWLQTNNSENYPAPKVSGKTGSPVDQTLRDFLNRYQIGPAKNPKNP